MHSAEQVNQMCTKSHFFPVASAAAVRQAAEASLAARVTGGYSSSSRACSAARTGAVSWYSAASRVDGAIALVNSRQRGGEIDSLPSEYPPLWRPWAVRSLPSSSNIRASTCVSMPWVRRYSSITVSLSQPTANSVNAQPTPVRSLPTAQCCSKAPSKGVVSGRRAGDRPGC